MTELDEAAEALRLAQRTLTADYDLSLGDGGGSSAPSASQMMLNQYRNDAATSIGQQEAGKPYEYGGSGEGSTNVVTGQPSYSSDCTGLAGDMLSVFTGQESSGEYLTDPQGTRFNTTTDMESMGLEPGARPGTLQIGVNPNPGTEGHAAVELPSGDRAESSGGDGVEFGAGARSITDPAFTEQWHLPGSELPPQSSTPTVGDMLGGGKVGSVFDEAAAAIRLATEVLDKDQELQDLYTLQRSSEGCPQCAAGVTHYHDDDLPKPEPIKQPAKDILNEYLQARGRRNRRPITMACPECKGSGTKRDIFGTPNQCNQCDGGGTAVKPEVESKMRDWAERLEHALHNEFMEWWPTSEAARTRTPETSGTKWSDHPKFPVTHWLNVEDFLMERYPEAATGSKYGGEYAQPLIDKQLDADKKGTPQPDAEWLESHGYIGGGNVITQAFLNLHNLYNRRPWRSRDDKRRTYELMLRHIGPGARKSPKAAASSRNVPLSPSAVTDDIVYGLSKKFDDWAKAVGAKNPYDERLFENGVTPKNSWVRGPIGYWPNIENFLKENYPAAHRGLQFGFEDAMPLLDGWIPPEGQSTRGTPYETGPEAVEKHGYDPAEIVSTMLLLHNDTHPGRVNYLKSDQKRLLDIAQKRYQMQRAYEQRTAHRTAMPAPAPKGLRFQHDPNWIHPNAPADHAKYLGRVEAYIGDDRVGYVDWLKKGNPLTLVTDRKPGEVSYIHVEEPYRRHSIATEMFRWARDNAEPDLHHSQRRTDLGEKWIEYEQGRELDRAAAAIRQAQKVLAISEGVDYDDTAYYAEAWDDDDDEDAASSVQQLHRGVGFRKGDLPPELEQQMEAALAGDVNPDFVNSLLTHLHRNGEGMGGFWAHSKDGPWLAEGFSRRIQPSPWENHPADYSIVLSADWDGKNSIYDWDDDSDYRKLLPGTKLNITKVRLAAPQTKGWIDLGGDPTVRHAAKTQNGILADETIERLRGEFADWWDQQNHRGYTPNPAYDAAHYWSNIESFLKDRYPAAHRGLDYGYEQARPLLKQKNDRQWGDIPDADPYDATPEEITKYGYDPAEIAAGMLYLHNDRRSGRQSFQNADRNLLMKVIRQRHKMQQEYDSKPRQLELPLDLQKAAAAIREAQQILAMPAVDAYDKHIPRKKRLTEHDYIPKGPWYHGTDYELEDGTILVPSGGESKYTNTMYKHPDMKNRMNWVWLAPGPNLANRWGQHVYEVEPLDEGPWPWNGDGDSFTQFVVPRARIVRKLAPATAAGVFASKQTRTAMPALPPEGLHFKYHHTNDSIPPGYSGETQGGAHTFLAPAVAAYVGDKPVGYVEWWPTHRYPNAKQHYRYMDKGKPGEVYYIYVRPELRRHNIGTMLYDWAKQNAEPDLHHSPKRSELGKQWISHEEGRDLQRAAATVSQDVVKRLDGEFKEWWKNTGYTWDFDERGDDEKRGPIGDWPSIEEFLEERYPAAYRGMMMGQEMARPLLDGVGRHDEDQHPRNFNMLQVTYGDNVAPYETGADAVAKHGYDPREVASAMLLLHNKSHPLRGYRGQEDQARLDEIARKRDEEFANADIDVLHDIVQKRHRMQHAALHNAAITIREASTLLAKQKVDPNYFSALHEMGHVMDAVNGFKASDTLDEALMPVYTAETGNPMSDEPGGHWIGYHKWLRENLPGRAWEPRLDMYGRPQGFDDFNPKEAVASVFVEHEINPEASTAAMRALHQHVVDHSLKAERPTNLTTFRPRAKPPADIDPEDGAWPTGKLPRAFMDGIQYVFSKYPQSRIVDRVDPLEMSKGGNSPVTNTVLKDINSRPRIEYDDRAALSPNLVDELFERERQRKQISPWLWEDDMLAKAAAVLRFAEPMADAYDPDAIWHDDYVSPERAEAKKHPGPWYHITPWTLRPGGRLEPSNVRNPEWGNYEYLSDEDYMKARQQGLRGIPARRQNWVWMTSRDRIPYWMNIMRGINAPLNVYEVTPEVEGPWPYNGSGQEGYVSPAATVVREIPHKDGQIQWPEDDPVQQAEQAIKVAQRVLAMPAVDAYDDEPFYYDGAEEGERIHDYAPPDAPKLYAENSTGKWYHTTPHKLEVGSTLKPRGGASPWQTELAKRRNAKDWVWMDTDEGIQDWFYTTGRELNHDPDNFVPIYLYEVQPDEGPYPWNGTGSQGHVSPSATVTAEIPIHYWTHGNSEPQILWPEGHDWHIPPEELAELDAIIPFGGEGDGEELEWEDSHTPGF